MTVLTDSQIYFDGVNLSSITDASIKDHNFNNLPNRDIKKFKLARIDKSVVTSAEYSDKEVTVDFHLCGITRSATETVMSNLKTYLRPISKTLLVQQYGETIEYLGASLNQIDYKWFGNKIILTLVFIVANPIAQDEDITVGYTGTVTDSTASLPLTISGSFDAEPVFSLTNTTITGGASQSLIIKNNDTGQGITITRTWASGDTVEIDSANQKVTVNGANTDFSGKFPTFTPGVKTIGYIDTFTTRSVLLTVTYRKRYI